MNNTYPPAEGRGIFSCLHRAGDGQHRRAGGGAVRAGGGVLREGGRGYRDHAGHRGEYAGSRVIGVLGGGGQRRAVQRHRQVRQPRVEGVGDNDGRRGVRRRVAGVLDGEGVRQAAVLRHRGGGEGLVDGQCRRRLRCHRLRGGNGVCQPRAGDGRAVGDGALRRRRREGRGHGLIGDNGIAARRHGDAGERQRRPGGDGGCRLQNAVLIVPHRPGGVGQGIHRPGVEGVAAQIVGNGQPRQRCGAAVDQREDIRHAAVGAVGGHHGGLGGGQRLRQLTHRHVGGGGLAVIGQRCLVGESCHDRTSCV